MFKVFGSRISMQIEPILHVIGLGRSGSNANPNMREQGKMSCDPYYSQEYAGTCRHWVGKAP